LKYIKLKAGHLPFIMDVGVNFVTRNLKSPEQNEIKPNFEDSYFTNA